MKQVIAECSAKIANVLYSKPAFEKLFSPPEKNPVYTHCYARVSKQLHGMFVVNDKACSHP